jgi:hypothetical protein
VRAGPAKVLREPVNAAERAACEAAAVICPTSAIALEPFPAGDEVKTEGAAELFPTLLDVTEGVRWKVQDLPWDRFDAAAITPEFRALVREMAYSEQTTFSATQRFMEAFGADADFSQWISVWFYEETRHPLVLLKWLALAGITTDDDFVKKGRESQPFLPSLVGTLVMNIVSEMVAAAAYLHAVGGAPEPVIKAVVTRLAGDEARHAASFFVFAQRQLSKSAAADREKLDALKVLHFWFNVSGDVSHPVNEAMERIRPLLEAAGAPAFIPPNDRIARVVGLLLGAPMSAAADLGAHLLEHTRRVRAAQTRPV